MKTVGYALARRLQPVARPDQYRSIRIYKNRYIGFNIRLIEDIIDYSENLEIDSAILFLDFKKAFDMVEWPFMFSTLKYMGFWDSFLKCFSTFYTNITCKYYNI